MYRKQLRSVEKGLPEGVGPKSGTVSEKRYRELEDQLNAVGKLMEDRDEESREKSQTITEVAQRNELLVNENSELKLQLDDTLDALRRKESELEMLMADLMKEREEKRNRELSQNKKIEVPKYTFTSPEMDVNTPREIIYSRDEGPPTEERLVRQMHSEDLNCFAHGNARGADNRFLVLGSNDGMVKLVDYPTLKSRVQIRVSTESTSVLSVSLSSESNYLIQASTDNVVRVFDVGGRQIHSLKSHGHKVYACGFLPENRAYTASLDRTLKLWDLQQGSLIQSLPAESAITGGCVGGPNSELLVTSHQNGRLGLWDVRQSSLFKMLGVDEPEVATGVSLSKDGKLVASQSRSNKVVITSLDTYRPVCELKHSSFQSQPFAASPQFSPNGQYIVACGKNALHLWRIDAEEHIAALDNGYAPTSVAWLDSVLVTTQKKGYVTFWGPPRAENQL